MAPIDRDHDSRQMAGYHGRDQVAPINQEFFGAGAGNMTESRHADESLPVIARFEVRRRPRYPANCFWSVIQNSRKSCESPTPRKFKGVGSTKPFTINAGPNTG